jgi:hypothetical protein
VNSHARKFEPVSKACRPPPGFRSRFLREIFRLFVIVAQRQGKTIQIRQLPDELTLERSVATMGVRSVILICLDHVASTPWRSSPGRAARFLILVNKAEQLITRAAAEICRRGALNCDRKNGFSAPAGGIDRVSRLD